MHFQHSIPSGQVDISTNLEVWPKDIENVGCIKSFSPGYFGLNESVIVYFSVFGVFCKAYEQLSVH